MKKILIGFLVGVIVTGLITGALYLNQKANNLYWIKTAEGEIRNLRDLSSMEKALEFNNNNPDTNTLLQMSKCRKLYDLEWFMLHAEWRVENPSSLLDRFYSKRFITILSPQIKRLKEEKGYDNCFSDASYLTKKIELVCPIGGEKFDYDLTLGTIVTGVFLDGRRVGPLPTDNNHAQCPGNKFVFQVSVHEPDDPSYDTEQLEKFETYIETDEYKTLVANNTSLNYINAKLTQFIYLNAEPKRTSLVAKLIVDATHDMLEDPETFKKYALEAIDMIDLSIQENGEAKNYPGPSLLDLRFEQLDLLRQLKRFPEARIKLNELESDWEYQTLHHQDSYSVERLELQKELIEQENHEPYERVNKLPVYNDSYTIESQIYF